jgi:hypothetical protein
MKTGNCEQCGKEDLLIFVDQVKKDLCPHCAAPKVGIPEKLLRDFLSANPNISKF